MPTNRRITILVTAAAAVLLALVIPRCSGDDDGADRDNGNGNGSEEGDGTPTAPAGDGTTPPAPDLSEELATVQSSDGRWEVVVNELRQEGDRVTLWATFTNTSDDRHLLGRGFADPTLRDIEQIERGDLAGVYLIDWAAGKAYYPMATDQGDGGMCLCSKVSSTALRPDESLAVFAVYNGVDELEDATLVVPGFLPADGLAPS